GLRHDTQLGIDTARTLRPRPATLERRSEAARDGEHRRVDAVVEDELPGGAALRRGDVVLANGHSAVRRRRAAVGPRQAEAKTAELARRAARCRQGIVG